MFLIRNFKDAYNSAKDWFENIDSDAILYSLIASAIFAVIVYLIRKRSKIFMSFFEIGYRLKYRKKIKEECSNLLVVGKRKGFSTKDTYVSMDIAYSDLSKNQESIMDNTTCVITGGPGAGKSTHVKKLILDQLDSSKFSLPLFFRLRDFAKYSTIEEALSANFEQITKCHNASDIIKKILFNEKAFCVLDGLDEVKPEERSNIIDLINCFYKRYFLKTGILIVTCRKEAYRDIPLSIPTILEVCPLTDDQIEKFCNNWPLGYPSEKSASTFIRDLKATEKIQELSRSPLLLVGGLMQYTESNRGIPDERYKYLERVACWLISDWATAQGHPPDHFRPIYDRVLPIIAFNMHKKQTAELANEDLIEIIKPVLPQFGFSEKKAEEILDSLRTKTGIIVKDDKNNFIFSQFGLQEYFSSLEMKEVIKPDQIMTLTPLGWWREVILLGIAQLRTPDEFLDNLEKIDKALAACAVAECPTPSISQQIKTIDQCIALIDEKQESVKPPIIQLLRKVEGAQLEKLCNALEARLKNPQLASLIGLILATAGSKAANNILAKHPNIWKECLSNTGYLSDSFENLLFEWLETGDEQQSFEATDIMIERIRVNNFFKLLKLLPELSKNKSDYLSKKIISMLISPNINKTARIGFSRIFVISRCLPYVRNAKDFIKNKVTAELRKNEELLTRNYSFLQSNYQLIITMIFLKKEKENYYDSAKIEKIVNNSKEYSQLLKQYMASFSIPLIYLVNQAIGINNLFLAILLPLLLVFSIYKRMELEPWNIYLDGGFSHRQLIFDYTYFNMIRSFHWLSPLIMAAIVFITAYQLNCTQHSDLLFFISIFLQFVLIIDIRVETFQFKNPLKKHSIYGDIVNEYQFEKARNEYFLIIFIVLSIIFISIFEILKRQRTDFFNNKKEFYIILSVLSTLSIFVRIMYLFYYHKKTARALKYGHEYINKK